MKPTDQEALAQSREDVQRLRGHVPCLCKNDIVNTCSHTVVSFLWISWVGGCHPCFLFRMFQVA